MISPFRSGRPLALAAATLIASASIASAQTVIARKAPAGSTIEVIVNAGPAGSGVANAGGDAIIPLAPPLTAGKAEVATTIFVDSCASLHRIVIVDRDLVAPPPAEGCTRRLVAGTFVVRAVSTIVVNVEGTTPSVLLRQGKFSLAPPRQWRAAPTGFFVFGGAGIATFRDAPLLACGNVDDCAAKDMGVAYAVGTGYWLGRFVEVELSYQKPAELTVSGTSPPFTFDSTLDAHLLMLGAHVALPIGPVRLMAGGGANYHRATFTTNQTAGAGTNATSDVFSLTTAGWGSQVDAGIEAWVAPKFAIYADAGIAWIKGSARRPADARIDDRTKFVIVGIRVSLKR